MLNHEITTTPHIPARTARVDVPWTWSDGAPMPSGRRYYVSADITYHPPSRDCEAKLSTSFPVLHDPIEDEDATAQASAADYAHAQALIRGVVDQYLNDLEPVDVSDYIG